MARAARAAAPSDADRIIDAAFARIAETGWRRLSLAAVAAEAGLPIVRVYRTFPSKNAILLAWMRRIDDAVLAAAPAPDEAERPRDRVFDLVMRRFDALAPYKPALAVLRRELPLDPPAARGRRHPDRRARRPGRGQADGRGLCACVAALGERRLARSGADDGRARPAPARVRTLARSRPRPPARRGRRRSLRFVALHKRP